MSFKDIFGLIVFIWCGCYVEGDIFEQLREACPYSQFCTVNSLKEIGESDSDKGSCCMDCFCDEACYSYDDCCPDVETMVPKPDHVTTLGCVSSSSKTPYLLTHDRATLYPNKYHMYDACPTGYLDKDDTIIKCGEAGYTTLDFDDLVMVSDTSGRLFKNKHCALCHGVTNITRWILITSTCETSIFDKRLAASEVDTYVYNYCILNSVKPTGIPRNSRGLQCNIMPVSTCPDHFANESEENREIANGCYNGPVMPIESKRNDIQLYKNALCKLCNDRYEMMKDDDVCLVDDQITERSMGSYTMALLIDGSRTFSDERSTEVCDESQVFFQGQCIELYCPPFHAVSYGECHQLSYTSFTVILYLYFPCDNILTCAMSELIQTYQPRQEETLFRELYQRFMQFGCQVTSYFAISQQEISSYRIESIELDVQVELNSECTIHGLGTMIRKLDRMVISWLLNGNIVNMKGRFTFFNQRMTPGSSRSHRRSFARFGYMHRAKPNHFGVCPYVLLDADEYGSLVSRLHEDGGRKSEGNFTMVTETIPGTFALSGNMIAVCLDVYLGTSGSCTYTLSYLGLHTLVTILTLLTKWLAS